MPDQDMLDTGSPEMVNPVRRLRDRLQFSQADLASVSGVSVDAIRKIEQGTRTRPWPRTIRALAIHLGIGPDELHRRLLDHTQRARKERTS